MENNQFPHELQERIAKLPEHKKKLFLARLNGGLNNQEPIDKTNNFEQQPITAPHKALVENQFLPLSYSQLLMWFVMLLSNKQKNEMSIKDLYGEIDFNKLKIAMQKIVNDHAIFSLKCYKFKPVQQFKKIDPVKIAYQDISQLAEPEKIKALAEAQLKLEEYQFTNPPYIKAALVKLAPHRYRLFLGFSHTVTDAQSKNNVWLQLINSYQALVENAEDMPTASSDYYQFIEFERRYYGKNLKNISHFLDGYLQDACFVSIPKHYMLAAENEITRNKQIVTMPAELVAKLKEYAASNKLFFEELLLGGYARAICQYTSNSTLYIQQVTNGIFEAPFKDLIGPRLQERLLKLTIQKQDNLIATLKQLHHEFIAGMEHISYPLSFGLGRLCLAAMKSPTWLVNSLVKWIAKLYRANTELNEAIIKSYVGIILDGKDRIYKQIIPKKIREFFTKKTHREVMLVVNFRHNIKTYEYENERDSLSQNAIKKVVEITPDIYTAYEEYIVLTVDQTNDDSFKFYLESFLIDEVSVEILQTMIKDLETLTLS